MNVSIVYLECPQLVIESAKNDILITLRDPVERLSQWQFLHQAVLNNLYYSAFLSQGWTLKFLGEKFVLSYSDRVGQISFHLSLSREIGTAMVLNVLALLQAL